MKKYDKVNQRIGRLAQKYPSVHKLYEIVIEKDAKDVCTSMKWEKKGQATLDKENTYGVYFTILGWVKTLAFQAKSFIVVYLDLDLDLDLDHTQQSVSHTRYFLILHNCIMD